MRLYEILEPIAEYVRKLKKRETLTAKGEVRAIPGKTTDICSLKLKPNREYLVSASTDLGGTGFDPNAIMCAALEITGGVKIVGHYATRTITSAGGGCVVTRYVKIGDSAGVAKLSGYGYASGTYNYRGEIFAVEI